MLENLPDFMDPELPWVLAAMGHGDVLGTALEVHRLARARGEVGRP